MPGQESVNKLFQQAIAHFRQSDLDNAASIANAILDRQRGYAGANHLLGFIAGQRGEYTQAADFFLCAIKTNPAEASYHFSHGLALHKAGNGETALASFDTAIKLNPENAEAHNFHGAALGARPTTCWQY